MGAGAAEAVTILECIGDAMAAPDAALRGFASKCMAEFMSWAIKQSVPTCVLFQCVSRVVHLSRPAGLRLRESGP